MNSSPALSGLLVCVLCDSKAYVAGMGDLLRASQCKVVTQFEAEVDVVLIDAELGTERVRECLHSIRSSSARRAPQDQTKSLVMTSDDSPRELLAWIDLGVDDLIEKSRMRDTLIARLMLLTKRSQPALREIGPIRHELANVVSIFDGKCSKLASKHPELCSDSDFVSLQETVRRMIAALQELRKLAHRD